MRTMYGRRWLRRERMNGWLADWGISAVAQVTCAFRMSGPSAMAIRWPIKTFGTNADSSVGRRLVESPRKNPWRFPVVALLIAISAASCATSPARDIPYPESAISLGVRLPEQANVCSMTLLSSQRIARYLPGCAVYATTALKYTGNPAFVRQPFIIPPSGGPILLPDYATSAAFVSELNMKVSGLPGARERLLLLADMQGWDLCRGIPDEMRAREEITDPKWIEGWDYREERVSSGWLFHCAFLTDPLIRDYASFRVVVSDNGTIVIQNVSRLGRPPGHSGHI